MLYLYLGFNSNFTVMSQKELIISLIQQDLKHCLEILDIVANLMQVPGGHVEYDWCRLYVTYMQECKTVGVTHTTETMKPFAEACYAGLVEIVDSASEGLS